MFGGLFAIISGAIVANEALNNAEITNKKRRKARNGNKKTYFDAHGVQRNTRTGKKVGMYEGVGHYTRCSDYDCTCQYYSKNGVVTPKKIMYGVMKKDVARVLMMNERFKKYIFHKISLDMVNLVVSSNFKPDMSHLNYYEKIFETEKEATNYVENTYKNEEKKYMICKLFIPPFDSDYYKHRSFEEMCNDKKPDDFYKAIEYVEVDGKKYVYMSWIINQAVKDPELVDQIPCWQWN